MIDAPSSRRHGTSAALVAILLLSGCASDQRRLVKSQVAHIYHATRQVTMCSVAKPKINCNLAAKALDQWTADEKLAIQSSAMACNGKPSEACATHGMMADVLAALKRDRAATRKAGVK